jgi:hypothetical protein
MKLFLLFLVMSLTSLSHGIIETAVESPGIKAEYYETSKTGKIFVIDCNQCDRSFYSFSSTPKITKNGLDISFKKFMADPKKGGFTTLILNLQDDSVLRINY